MVYIKHENKELDMDVKSDLSRITIDIPKEAHRRLKSRAALLGKSMREVILEALELTEECLYSEHIPNKKTLKAIKDAEDGKGLVKGKKAEAFSKKFGL